MSIALLNKGEEKSQWFCTFLKISRWREASYKERKNKQTSTVQRAEKADSLFHYCWSEWERANESPQVGHFKETVLVVAPSPFLLHHSAPIPDKHRSKTKPEGLAPDRRQLLLLQNTRSLPTVLCPGWRVRFAASLFWRGKNEAVPLPRREWQQIDNTAVLFVC